MSLFNFLPNERPAVGDPETWGLVRSPLTHPALLTPLASSSASDSLPCLVLLGVKPEAQAPKRPGSAFPLQTLTLQLLISSPAWGNAASEQSACNEPCCLSRTFSLALQLC